MNANKQDAGGEVTNPDNVGELPELPESPYIQTVYHNTPHRQGTELRRFYTEDQMRAYGELCRAAPAGGDVAVGEIGELNGTKLIVGRDEDALARLPKGTKLYTRPQDSAPAGSGEVSDDMVERACVAWMGNKIDDWADLSTQTQKDIRDGMRQALTAALLRKLQQGAE